MLIVFIFLSVGDCFFPLVALDKNWIFPSALPLITSKDPMKLIFQDAYAHRGTFFNTGYFSTY